MCGIAGVVDINQQNLNIREGVLRRVAQSIAHRGPDDEGIYMEGPVALVHKRLSILDVSEAGKQPFWSADRRYAIVFNGEIYNYKEFYEELKQKGFQFRTGTDTEVLLYMWMSYGANMLHRLNGMWAFAIWDQEERELLLCRDRLGVKPLYYAQEKGTLLFASEPKALFAFGMAADISEDHLREHFVFRYVDGENTLYKNVKKLLPGHFLRVKNKQLHHYRWWNLKERANAFPSIKNPFNWFDELFHESVNYRMVSDVPAGLLLSGGLDSSSVALALQENGFRDIHTFTIRFSQVEYNEGPLALRLSEQLNFKPHDLLLEDEALLENTIKATIAADQPLVHQNDGHLVAISKLSKDFVKVLLSGEGADELMGGYVRYKTFPYIRSLVSMRALLQILPGKHHRIKKLKQYLFTSEINMLMIWNGNNFFPEELDRLGIRFESKTAYREQVLKEACDLEFNDPVKQLLYLEQHTYLQTLLDRNDTTTMMSGIECREPFLDFRIVEGLMSLPSNYFVKGKKGKHILGQSIGARLPDYIKKFRKIGLSVPWNDYIRSSPELQDYIKDSDVFATIFKLNLNPIIKDFLKGDNQNAMLVRYLFFFNLWYKNRI